MRIWNSKAKKQFIMAYGMLSFIKNDLIFEAT